MKWMAILAALSTCCAVSPAQGQALPPAPPTARDLYVGCYLYVHGNDVPKDTTGHAENYSASWCGLAAIKAVTYREGEQPEHKGLTFCLPKTSEMSTDPARAMAFAYLDYYEKYISYFETKRPGTPSADGETFYTAAMISRWPCP